MAQKDIAQKLLEDYEDVFADIVNVLVFDGEEVVHPDALEPSNLLSQYKAASDGKLHEQERDVVKYWKDGDVRIGLIGLENQTKAEREMVLRVLGYDGAAYRDQLRKSTDGEEKTLFPVLTLVLYFGEDHWNKPKTLKELLDISEDLDDYVSDYRINVVEIAWLDDDTIRKFTSDFRIVADFFVQKRKNKHYRPSAEKIQHVDELLKLLAAFTGDPAYGELIPANLKGDATMCRFVDQFRNEGMERGLEQGLERGLVQGRTDEQKRIAENMLTQGLKDALIISVTGITQECLNTIKDTLQPCK
ncbi:MAG: Rpn family recombination-promoting nuclease/putative transposase [Lachnospiraceae bacterium]|nr:Rpn family recombination-promoting nuclease/putative transposase [Lachnospiraceae bacterium]